MGKIKMLKNAIAYEFNKDFNLTADQIEVALNQKPYRQLSSHESKSLTVSHFFENDDKLAYESEGGHIFIKLTSQAKLLPNDVVNDEVKERVEEIKNNDGRSISKKELNEIKEEVIFELLPKSFVRRKSTIVMISLKERRLMVDTSSGAKADDVTAFLRECLGSLDIKPLQNTYDVKKRLTGLLKKAPGDFELLEDFEITSSLDSQSKLKIKNLTLRSNQIVEYIEEGLLLSQLRINYDDNVEFTLKDNASIARIKYAENETVDNAETKKEAIQTQCFLTSMSINKIFNILDIEFKINDFE